jgi:predicted Zn-dependent protease with MMP-like domain
MNDETFRAVALEAWDAMPPHFKAKVENVALLVEDEPDAPLREEEGLMEGETLLGHYHGIPATARGSEYGIGETLPDTITLYRLPILDAAEELTDDHTSDFRKYVAQVVRETLWHEIGHYFGLDEEPINEREAGGTNFF